MTHLSMKEYSAIGLLFNKLNVNQGLREDIIELKDRNIEV